LRSLSLREQSTDEELAFAASRPEGAPLLDRAFERSELEQAERILVLGPYFDSDNTGLQCELGEAAQE